MQQALYHINKASKSFQEVAATIYLTKGTHHFFQCGLNQAQASEVEDDEIDFNALCQIESLKAFSPETDNVALVVKPLYCDSDI